MKIYKLSRHRAAFITSVIAMSAFGIFLPRTAHAITPLISASVGSGPDTAYFVLDFQDEGDSYAFAYNYDASAGSVTGSDLIDALISGTASNSDVNQRFIADFSTDPVWGRYYQGFSYNGQSATPTGNAYWEYWTSINGVDWQSADVGADTYTIQAGQYTSFSINPDWTNSNTPPPMTPQAVTVPESSSAALFVPTVTGALGLLLVRRRRTR